MKKLALTVIAGAAIAFTPFSSFALSPMSVDGLKDATGQAGVSIAVDNVKIMTTTGTTIYTDADGADLLTDTVANMLSGYTNGTDTSASISIGGKSKTQYINAIIGGQTSANAQALTGLTRTYVNTMDTTATPTESLFETRALTIDVGTCDLLSRGNQANFSSAIEPFASLTSAAAGASTPVDLTTKTIAGVVIGLPTLEILTEESGDYDISITQAGALNSGMVFINIEKTGRSSLAILNGTLEIAAH